MAIFAVWHVGIGNKRYKPGERLPEVDDATWKRLAEAGAINSNVAKEVFEKIFDEDVEPESYIEQHGLRTVSDTELLRKAVEEAVAANPQSVQDYQSGKEKALGYLVGQVMRQMKGKANPAAVHQLLTELLRENG